MYYNEYLKFHEINLKFYYEIDSENEIELIEKIIEHYENNKILINSFAKKVRGDRKYKWSNAKNPPKMVNPINTL